MHRRTRVASLIATIALVAISCSSDDSGSEPAPPPCERTTPDGWSVARVWDEAALSAIRRDFPAPTVHARNLYHLSAALWDAWTAFDDPGTGVFADRDVDPGADLTAARRR